MFKKGTMIVVVAVIAAVGVPYAWSQSKAQVESMEQAALKVHEGDYYVKQFEQFKNLPLPVPDAPEAGTQGSGGTNRFRLFSDLPPEATTTTTTTTRAPRVITRETGRDSGTKGSPGSGGTNSPNVYKPSNPQPPSEQDIDRAIASYEEALRLQPKGTWTLPKKHSGKVTSTSLSALPPEGGIQASLEKAKRIKQQWLTVEKPQKEREQQLAIQARQERQQLERTLAAAGYIRLSSWVTGIIMFNGEATEFSVKAGESIDIIAEDAKDKEYSVSVRDSNGKVCNAEQKVTITEIGVDNNRKPKQLFLVVVLDPSPAPNSGDDFAVTQNSDGTITITKYTGSRVQVVIPQTIEGIRVTTIADRAFANNSAKIVSIVIPNTVTRIGADAFRGQSISSLTIPDSVTFIGEGAFYGNGLTSLTLGKGLVAIEDGSDQPGKGVFENNNLTSVSLPATLKKIGMQAFRGNKIQSLTIPNGVTFLGKDSFADNPPLTTVVIPASLAKITVETHNLFGYNVQTVTSGFAGAFPDSNITTITLPANVQDGNFTASGGWNNLSPNFSQDLLNFYISQGRKAGTYTFSGRLWSVR